MATVRDCRICQSPYRNEIESLIKKKVPRVEIARHYCDVFGVKEEQLYDSIETHTKKKHPPLISQMPELSVYKPEPEGEEQKPKAPLTQEEYARRVLEIGLSGDLMNPSKIRHVDVYRSQKLLLEKQKVENQRNALQLSMAKLFSGMLKPSDVVEGEIANEPASELSEGN